MNGLLICSARMKVLEKASASLASPKCGSDRLVDGQ